MARACSRRITDQGLIETRVRFFDILNNNSNGENMDSEHPRTTNTNYKCLTINLSGITKLDRIIYKLRVRVNMFEHVSKKSMLINSVSLYTFILLSKF